MASRNESVQKFLDKVNRLTINSQSREAISHTIREQALKIASAMRSEIDKSYNPGPHTGKLKESVRVEATPSLGGTVGGGSPRGATLTYLIRAGGSLTTVDGYDYAIAKEFGTSRQRAEPFFYSTARRMEPQVLRAIEKTILEEFSEKPVFEAQVLLGLESVVGGGGI